MFIPFSVGFRWFLLSIIESWGTCGHHWSHLALNFACYDITSIDIMIYIYISNDIHIMLDIHRHSMIINSLLQTSFSQWHLAFCWFFFVGSWPPKSGDIWWPGSPRNDGDKNAHQNWIEVLQQGKKNAFETWNSKFQNWHFNSPSIFLGAKT